MTPSNKVGMVKIQAQPLRTPKPARCRILPLPHFHRPTMPPPAAAKPRLAYIDWMRRLACLLMFQTHCYDSWLSADARGGALFHWSQLLGTMPAPLFLFLSGVSFALVTERLWEKGTARDTIARLTIWRGFEIYAAGVLFRVQEYVLGYPHSPWTDLLRVDVLNILGIGM